MREPGSTTTPAWWQGTAPAGARAGGPEPEAAQDRALLARVGAGERAALAELYDRHAAAMTGVALRILRDRSDAEDLVHDVFLEAWKHSEGYDPARASVRTWLLVRVRSRAIDRLRSLDVARRHARRELDGAPREAVADDPSDAPDRRRARAILAALPEPQRHVLELSFFEGLSCSEIATRCDAPLGTVKSRLLAGMRALRRHFEAAEASDGG